MLLVCVLGLKLFGTHEHDLLRYFIKEYPNPTPSKQLIRFSAALSGDHLHLLVPHWGQNICKDTFHPGNDPFVLLPYKNCDHSRKKEESLGQNLGSLPELLDLSTFLVLWVKIQQALKTSSVWNLVWSKPTYPVQFWCNIWLNNPKLHVYKAYSLLHLNCGESSHVVQYRDREEKNRKQSWR